MMPLFALALSAVLADPTPALVPGNRPDTEQVEPGSAPPVKLWINSSGQFREGDRARVQVETRDDGYLIVFNYDTDGRLRVLFPIDPRDDALVRGGRRYEIQGRADRESFLVGRDGNGLVYAAISADPFRLDEIQAAGNWDYTRLTMGADSRDAEADITDILQKMSTDRGFDYDVMDYRVYGYQDRYVAASSWYPRPYGFYDDNYCDSYYRPSLFGCRYYPAGGWYLGYSPYRYGYSGYGSYGGWSDPWYYGRGRGGYGTVGSYRYPVITGRPRGYSVVRRDGNNRNGSIARSPFGGGFGGGSIGGGSRPAIDSRPRNWDGGRRPGEGRRVSLPDRGPAVERDRGRGERGPVDFGGRARGPDRPQIERERPAQSERARPVQTERERPAQTERERPRAAERPRNDSPPARHDAPPSAPRSGGGGSGGGSHRPHRP